MEQIQVEQMQAAQDVSVLVMEHDPVYEQQLRYVLDMTINEPTPPELASAASAEKQETDAHAHADGGEVMMLQAL
jgi:hypothetical protein